MHFAHRVSSFIAGDFRTRGLAFQGLFGVPQDLNVIFGAGTVDFVSLRSPFISEWHRLQREVVYIAGIIIKMLRIPEAVLTQG